MPTFVKKKNPSKVAGGRARAAQQQQPAFTEPPVIFDEFMEDAEAEPAERPLGDVITTATHFNVGKLQLARSAVRRTAVSSIAISTRVSCILGVRYSEKIMERMASRERVARRVGLVL